MASELIALREYEAGIKRNKMTTSLSTGFQFLAQIVEHGALA
jgi:hypothetical protein